MRKYEFAEQETRQTLASAPGETVEHITRPRGSRLVFRSARFEDYDQLARLETTLSPETLPFDEWQMLWTANPLWPEISSWWPIGWVLETSERQLVGCISNIPLLYHFRGERLLAASGRGWLVLPEHRAFGSALRLARAHFDQPFVDLVIDTTVSKQGGERAGHLTNKIPAGDWESVAFFITDYRAFAARALQKLRVPMAKTLAPPVGIGLHFKDTLLAKRLPKHRSSFAIEQTDRFDSRFDTFSGELLRQKPEIVLAARDSATLSWHYAVPMRKGRLWIFTASRDRQLRAYCVFERKDVGQELHRMRLIDYQTIEPETDLLAPMLAAALRRCVTDGVCVLDKSGLGLPAMRTFEECAPYRRKQPWPFWYRSSDPARAAELRQAKYWEPTEYDGDASIG